MIPFPLLDCCEMLAIDPKTLRHWVRQANMPLHAHPTDARIKCLTMEQVQHLVALHGRALSPLAPASTAFRAQTPSLLPSEAAPSADGARWEAQVQVGGSAFQQEADLINKLSHLETKVATMQEQLAHFALQLLNARELQYEHRLSALEALMQHPPEPSPSQQEVREARAIASYF